MCHCEAKPKQSAIVDCHVASLLAMTCFFYMKFTVFLSDIKTMAIKDYFPVILGVLKDFRVIGTVIVMLLVIEFAKFVTTYRKKPPKPKNKKASKAAAAPKEEKKEEKPAEGGEDSGGEEKK